MNLPSTLTNIPKVQLRKAKLWKTLSRIGEILLTMLVILVILAVMFSYIVLSVIMPTGQTGLLPY